MFLPSLILFAVGLMLATPLSAAEEILSFDSEISVAADASMVVTEAITVRAEGQNIRRGIYRDFPTRYRDTMGNHYVVGFDVQSVRRDGYSEPYFTEDRGNGVRVYIGNKNSTLEPGVYRYEITYKTTRQLGFFEQHDELYWNVTGNGWGFPINAATAVVELPAGVPADRITLAAYTGRSGARGNDFTARLNAEGLATFTATRPLAPAEGLTVVVGWPKGYVAEPSWVERQVWLLKDNSGLLVALLVLLLNAVYLWRMWLRFGVDPEAGVLFPRYAPPSELSPGACRYIQNMSADNRGFTAAVMNLAVQGRIKIHEGRTAALKAIQGRTVFETSLAHLSPFQKSLLTPFATWAERRLESAHDDTFVLEKLDDTAATEPLGQGERAVLGTLFNKQDLVLLSNANHELIAATIAAHKKALDHYYRAQHFKTNGTLAIPAGIAVIVGFIVVGFIGSAAVLPEIILVANVPLIVIALRLLRAPTKQGRKILDEIEGFTEYLTIAEADDLAGIEGVAGPMPEKTTALFERYLPYAVAFDVDQRWAKQFESVFARISAERGRSYRPAWYNSSRSVHSFGTMVTSMSSSLDTAISSSSTAPGSSSGGGGGGSSGGGGGGGGGGGW